jgi:hypothetical protein
MQLSSICSTSPLPSLGSCSLPWLTISTHIASRGMSCFCGFGSFLFQNWPQVEGVSRLACASMADVGIAVAVAKSIARVGREMRMSKLLTRVLQCEENESLPRRKIIRKRPDRKQEHLSSIYTQHCLAQEGRFSALPPHETSCRAVSSTRLNLLVTWTLMVYWSCEGCRVGLSVVFAVSRGTSRGTSC